MQMTNQSDQKNINHTEYTTPKIENPQNQPMQEQTDNRPKWTKREETVSKLTP